MLNNTTHSTKRNNSYEVPRNNYLCFNDSSVLTQTLYAKIRQLSEENKRLKRLSFIDSLTGLPNRRALFHSLKSEIDRAARDKTHLSIALIDIDWFKKINDNDGHLAGDKCLEAFGCLLKKVLRRPADECFRYGGEEFVVMLPDTDISGLAEVTNQIRSSCQNLSVPFANKRIRFSVSIGGTSAVGGKFLNTDRLLKCSDSLLYKAKAEGRNRCYIREDLISEEL